MEQLLPLNKISTMSSGFISESELAEKQRIRQEEWEKVRQPHQPLEMPEEAYDHRSLYERLEEQKQKKQLEYEEAHKLKNMIKGLDDDEIEFLDLVDKKKLEAEKLKDLEEKQELLEFRRKVEKLRETTLDQKFQSEIQCIRSTTSNSSGIKSQGELLKGIIKKKPSSSDLSSGKEAEAEVNREEYKNEFLGKKRKLSDQNVNSLGHKFPVLESGLTCVGILPGLCSYIETSDDSDHSSSGSEVSDDKKYDLTGRRIVYKSKDSQE